MGAVRRQIVLCVSCVPDRYLRVRHDRYLRLTAVKQRNNQQLQ